MGITRAEVLGYLSEGLDLSLGVVGSVWDAVGVIGFRLDCMVLMLCGYMCPGSCISIHISEWLDWYCSIGTLVLNMDAHDFHGVSVL